MAINGFSTGRDVSVNVTVPNGIALTIPAGSVTDFKYEQHTSELKSKGIDGNSRLAYIPDSWSGSIMLDRLSSSIDDYFAAVEAAYYAGQSTLPAIILETITEANGATTQYQFDGVALKLSKAGDWSADKKVDLEIGWMAAHRVKLQ